MPKADVRKVMALIDALDRKGVKSMTVTAQPGSPAELDAYILPASQTGAAWSTMTPGSIAAYAGASWVEVPAREGVRVWVDDLNLFVRHDGSAWAQGSAAEAIRVSAADRIVGSTTTAGAASEIPFTAAARALCDDADAAAQRATLGLVIGADVQAYHARLQDIAANLSGASGAVEKTGANTFGTYTVSAAGKALIDDADAAAQRATLGVVIGTDVQAQSARLQDIAANLSAASGAVEKTGANTFGTYTVSAAGKALIDDADAAAQRATLGAPGLSVSNTFTGAQTQTFTGDSWTTFQVRVANTSAYAQFKGQRARGTIASPTSVQGGDIIYAFTPEAYDGSAYVQAGGLDFVADSTWSSSKESYCRLATVSGGSWGERLRLNSTAILPGADNVQSFGSASRRATVVYAATGSINTSDARAKTKFEAIPEGVKRAVRRIIGGIGVYQWLASVEAKGESAARLHVGVTAQAVQEAFAAEGEDVTRWALFCADEIFEEVEVEQEVETLEPVEQDVWAYELLQDEESAKLSPVVTKAPVIERVPLFDAAGEPVLQDGVAVVIERPKYERRTVIEKRSVTRPVLDETGAPLVRLGVRYDQLGMLALAVYAETLAASAP